MKHLEIYKPFVGEEESRLHKKHAWHVDGYSYATNGISLIRYPGEFGYPSGKEFPKAETFDWNVARTEPVAITIENLTIDYPCPHCDQIPTGLPREIECGNCEGEGEVKCGCCGSDTECDECEGAGVLKLPPKTATDTCLRCYGSGSIFESIEIGDSTFNGNEVDLLIRNLYHVRFYPGSKITGHPGKDGLYFRFADHGQGFLMRMIK